jgi:hypothetical protein
MSEPRCTRTDDLIDRLVGDRLTPDDQAHAATCETCRPVLARAAAFDTELRRSARSLVVEELPVGILAPSLGEQVGHGTLERRGSPGFAAIAVAILILLAATAVALVPGASPPPAATSTVAPSPTSSISTRPFVQRFRTTEVIRGQLAKLDYSCNDGGPLASVGPEPDATVREAAVCVAPGSIGPLLAAVIVGESVRGDVVELVVKTDIMGDDTSENRALVADVIAKVFALALIDEGAGQSGGSWARVHVPQLEIGDDIDVVLRQIAFHAERQRTGSYLVVVRGVAAG